MASEPPAKADGPGDAIGALQRLLSNPVLKFRPRDLAEDLCDLHVSFKTDAAYAAAVLAFIREIQRAMRNPSAHGDELQHTLTGLRRGKFTPIGSKVACLRLVVRPYQGGLHVVAMRQSRVRS